MIDTLPTTAAPVEPTTPIRPSEALRLGRLLRPRRVEGSAFDGSDGACAYGAISAGGYRSWTRPTTYASCPVRYRWLRFWTRSCWASSPAAALGIVIHLNDYHHWDDDQIAAWLEGLGL